MRYLFHIIILFLLFNANNLNCQVPDSLSIANKANLQKQEINIDSLELRIRDLELEGKIYSSNIQYYSLLITLLFVVGGSIISYVNWLKYKAVFDKINKRINAIENEYKEYKIYLDDIIRLVFLTAHDNASRSAKEFEKIDQYSKAMNFHILSIFNIILYINYIKLHKYNKKTINLWIKDTKEHFEHIFDLYKKNKDIFRGQLKRDEQDSIISGINKIIDIESDLFHDETVNIELYKEEINNIEINENNN